MYWDGKSVLQTDGLNLVLSKEESTFLESVRLDNSGFKHKNGPFNILKTLWWKSYHYEVELPEKPFVQGGWVLVGGGVHQKEKRRYRILVKLIFKSYFQHTSNIHH